MSIETVPTSCATAGPCQDTGAFPDLGWLVIPGLILAAIVIGIVVYFAIKGGRGR